jgi:hypothetical protein
MAKKYKPIPAVPFDLLIRGHEGVNEDREKYGLGDHTISLIRTLADDHKKSSPSRIVSARSRNS